MLDPVLKTNWLARLRDPNSRQAKYALCSAINSGAKEGAEVGSNPMCCLGHLAWVANMTFEFKDNDVASRVSGQTCNETRDDGYLPLQAIGLPGPIQAQLWRKNDRDGDTLAEIADWVEANPEI